MPTPALVAPIGWVAERLGAGPDQHDVGRVAESSQQGDDLARRAVGGERGDDLERLIAAEAGEHELGGLHGADEGARPQLRGVAVVPAQPDPELARLDAALAFAADGVDGALDPVGPAGRLFLPPRAATPPLRRPR